MNRTVMIHSMESKTTNPIFFRFLVNKCLFGDKCKYRNIKNPNFIPIKKFTPNNNNNNNRLVGPPRGESLDEQASTYLTMQIRTLKLLANVNTVN